ncbi:helix-turn-helix domain-containing protein [Streptomyces sp. NPDC050988]|uniref:helix-turn-helix domain-containing protein n=1 Tax=Streptomyces sp. NPDC050988 TaxID=3365637 RepID=UPI0037B30A98
MPRTTSSPDWVVTRRQQIGDQIRAARVHANLTQQQVAEQIEMDRAKYNRIEQGHASPLLDTLILISGALDVPLADLVR